VRRSDLIDVSGLTEGNYIISIQSIRQTIRQHLIKNDWIAAVFFSITIIVGL
jgi:hypothetical protein